MPDEAPPDNATASIEPVVVERPCITRIAETAVGVKEVTVNGGPEVDVYLKSVGLGTGFYWCSAFVHERFRQCGKIFEPKREFAMALRWAKENPVFHKGDLDGYVSGGRISEPGDVYTLNYGSGKGHCGITTREDDEDVTGVEGNTNDDGSRNGNRVCIRIRDKETLWSVSRPWTKN